MSNLENNMSLKQRRLLAKEIAKEYGSWKRKLHREPTEDERRQIVAIGFSKARRRVPSIPEPNPGLIDAVAGLGYLVTKSEGVVMGPAAGIPMVNRNPSLAASMIGAATGAVVANALGNPGGVEDLDCSLCSGPLMFIGQLGMLEHYQCRNCGATVSTRSSEEVRKERLHREFDYGTNPLTQDEADAIRYLETKRVAQAQRAFQEGRPDEGKYYDGLAQGMRTVRRDYRGPGVSYTPNPLLMTVMGANPGPAYEENPRRRGRKVTMTIQEFARKLKSMNDPELWNNFLTKIKGYQKWSHGTLPSKVTVEAVDTPGVKGVMITYDAGKAPESTYIMPDGTKRKGAWKHPWDTMPDIMHDPEAGIAITKLRGKSRITDFYHK